MQDVHLLGYRNSNKCWRSILIIGGMRLMARDLKWEPLTDSPTGGWWQGWKTGGRGGGHDKKQLGPKSKRRLLHHVHKKAEVELTTLKWWLSNRRYAHLELECWRLTNQHTSRLASSRQVISSYDTSGSCTFEGDNEEHRRADRNAKARGNPGTLYRLKGHKGTEVYRRVARARVRTRSGHHNRWTKPTEEKYNTLGGKKWTKTNKNFVLGINATKQVDTLDTL